MSTSLAEQLQKLAVPQTSHLQRSDKKRASILFDLKEAASLSKETVYQIGVDGFEELKAKNPVFIPFEETLFHITAKSFERSVQSADANRKLDKNLRRFLHLLSPYFLMNAAHKTLEWLVHRYRINEYNQNDLILLILPYHDTNIFIRVLQIVDIKANDIRWTWLRPLQKPGVHLSKNVLYNHAAGNPAFIQLLSDNLLAAIKEHDKPTHLTVWFNFYCSTFVGALEKSSHIDETMVVQMLPSIIKGLKSEIPDFLAASCIILSKLLSKATLSDKTLIVLVDHLTQFNVPFLRLEKVSTLLVLYQSQSYKDFPLAVVQNLTVDNSMWCVQSLRELSEGGFSIDSLLSPLLCQTFTHLLERCEMQMKVVDFLKNLLNQLKLSDTVATELLQTVFATSLNSAIREAFWIKDILELLERQYPDIFDSQVGSIMREKQKESLFLKMITPRMDSVNGFVGMKLFRNLYHPEENIRQAAMSNLLLKLNASKVSIRGKNVLKNLFVDRLNDESVSVCKETLLIPDTILHQIFPSDELRKILLHLLYKHKFDKIVTKIVEKLVNIDDAGDDYEVIIALLPFVFITGDQEMPNSSSIAMKCATVIVSQFVPKCTVLKALQPMQMYLQSMHNHGTPKSVELFKTYLKELKFDCNELAAVSDKSANSHEIRFQFTIAMILAETATEFEPKAISLLIKQCKHLQFILKKDPANRYFRAYFQYVENFIQKMPPRMLHYSDLSQTDEKSQSYLDLFNFLLHGAFRSKGSDNASFGNALKIFFQQFCANNTEIDFLLNYSCCESTNVSPGMQLRALRSVKQLLQEKQHALPQTDLHLPCLLTALSNAHQEIRRTALECLYHLHHESTLTLAILDGQVEISQDEQQFPVILSNFMQKTKSTKAFESLIKFLQKSNPGAPIYVQYGIIFALSKLNDPMVYKDIVQLCAKDLESCVISWKIVHVCIEQFCGKFAAATRRQNEIWTFVKWALGNDKAMEDFASPATAMMNAIRKDVYAQFAPAIQKDVLDVIIAMTSTSTNPELVPAAIKLFKHIDLDAVTILHHLEMMRDVQSAKVQNRLRRRVSVVPSNDILDMLQWKQGVTVLEFIQDKKKMRNAEKIVAVLFDILKKCLDFDEQSGVEYPKQLVLTSILHFCDKIDAKTLPQNVFNMELVVQCIRASPNPQTHHHALLLLAKVAAFLPNQVLHHIMAIFTFMGSSVLRRDDAYSFQIITKTIETIIPILVSGKDRNMKCIIDVCRVFVDVILDVPDHRRMALYKQFLEQINPMACLHIFLLLMFASHVLSKQQTKEQINKRLDIARTLCLEFSPNIVIYNCIKLLEYVKSLPVDKEDYKEVGYATDLTSIFDVEGNSPKQFRHYKYTLVHLTSNLLGCKMFVNNVANLDAEQSEQLEEPFKKMIVSVLTYIQSTSKVAELNANTPQSQYWKVMLHLSYDILDSLNALLTSQMFILVIKGLMTHQLSTVKRRALELLNSKLQFSPEFFQDRDQTDFYTMIPPLIVIIKEVEKERLNCDQEIIIQTALLSLKHFIRLLAVHNPEKFVQILNFIAELIKSKISNNILASAVLCLAELCTNLRSHCIVTLNKFMPVLIKILKREIAEETPSLLLISTVTALQKLLDVVSLFLSPYLEKLLQVVCSLSAKWSGLEDKATPITMKLTSVRDKLAELIPARVLIPSIDIAYKSILDKSQYQSISPLMDILSGCLNTLKGNDLKQSLPELTSFFLRALDFRTEVMENASHQNADVNMVEGCVVNALKSLILKLSETSFRPLYYKLYDWALRSEEKSSRAITFYALSSCFANALKGLFVLFAGHFLSNAANLLDTCNVTKTEKVFTSDEEQNVQLLENVLSTLNSVFLYDSQKFINKDRFDLLMQPLADQLHNTLGDFQERIRRIVIPTLVNFTVATADDALWKQFNYQILLKMRDSNPIIRLFALECIRDICKKVGEDFLPLLPETIPFLAELLEDEEEEIEQACQKTIQEFEKVLGEPIQKYF